MYYKGAVNYVVAAGAAQALEGAVTSLTYATLLTPGTFIYAFPESKLAPFLTPSDYYQIIFRAGPVNGNVPGGVGVIASEGLMVAFTDGTTDALPTVYPPGVAITLGTAPPIVTSQVGNIVVPDRVGAFSYVFAYVATDGTLYHAATSVGAVFTFGPVPFAGAVQL